jgi:hypothetical protein
LRRTGISHGPEVELRLSRAVIRRQFDGSVGIAAVHGFLVVRFDDLGYSGIRRVRLLYSILAKLTVESIGTVLTVISIRYGRYEPAQQNMRRLFEGRWCFGNPDHDRYYLKHHVANGARDDGRHRRFQQHPDRRITHHLMDDGMPLKEAVQHAVRVRLRPILMTSLATVIGLIPITLALEAGSESYAPLARVIIGGTTRVGQF